MDSLRIAAIKESRLGFAISEYSPTITITMVTTSFTVAEMLLWFGLWLTFLLKTLSAAFVSLSEASRTTFADCSCEIRDSRSMLIIVSMESK